MYSCISFKSRQFFKQIYYLEQINVITGSPLGAEVPGQLPPLLPFNPALETLQMQDVNTNFSRLALLFEIILNKHALLKIMSRKQQRMHRKPWISKGILKSIKTKNKLFSETQNLDKPDSNKWNKYKKYRNKLNHIIEYAKMICFKNQIAQKGNNSRKLWSTINEILDKGKKQTNVINKVQNELGSSDTIAFDIADTLSKYFSSIGEKLANQIENQFQPHQRLLNHQTFRHPFSYLPPAQQKCKM